MASKIAVVLDTNVLISAFFGGNPAKIIELFVAEEIDLFYSLEILREYKEVLFREKFSHISEMKRKIMLESIIELGILITTSLRLSVIKDDPADNKFLECAVSASVDYLVTGNIHHFNFDTYEQVKIISPAQFIQKLILL